MPPEQTVLGPYKALAILEEEGPKPLIDLRAMAKEFVEKRLANTKSAEDIRSVALQRLDTALKDAEVEIRPGLLLDIIDTLNNSTKDDFETIVATGSKDGTGRTSGDIYNMFIGGAEQPRQALPQAVYPVLDGLVMAADAIVRGRPGLATAKAPAKKKATKKTTVVKKTPKLVLGKKGAKGVTRGRTK
jgi:hypothetical protein